MFPKLLEFSWALLYSHLYTNETYIIYKKIFSFSRFCRTLDFANVIFLYPPQRVSFVNTFVTPRNNVLGPYVPWRHLISAKF